jgi:hypothetical protein
VVLLGVFFENERRDYVEEEKAIGLTDKDLLGINGWEQAMGGERGNQLRG